MPAMLLGETRRRYPPDAAVRTHLVVVPAPFGDLGARLALRLLVTPSWWTRHGEATVNGLVPKRDAAARFSRGPTGVALAAAGVEVVGRLEDALVHNADLHRALAVACARFA